VAGAIAAALIAGGTLGAAAETAPGEGARRALERQSFPWYDAAEDRYRPLIRPGREDRGPADSAADDRPDESRGGGQSGRGRGSGTGSGSVSGSGSGSGRGGDSFRNPPPPPPSISLPSLDLGGLGWILMVTLFTAAVLAVIYLLVRFGLGKRDAPETETSSDQAAEDIDEDRLAALPDGARLAGSELLARAAAHADRGEFERAIVFFHAWQLLELDRRAGLTLARGKTNGHYADELAASTPQLAPLFRRSSRLFEDAFFGGLAVDRDDFLAVWAERDRITAAGRTTGA